MNIRYLSVYLYKFQTVNRPIDLHSDANVIQQAELSNSTSRGIGSAVGTCVGKLVS